MMTRMTHADTSSKRNRGLHGRCSYDVHELVEQDLCDSYSHLVERKTGGENLGSWWWFDSNWRQITQQVCHRQSSISQVSMDSDSSVPRLLFLSLFLDIFIQTVDTIWWRTITVQSLVGWGKPPVDVITQKQVHLGCWVVLCNLNDGKTFLIECLIELKLSPQ